ncbi:ABC transporter ATP-binding protein [Allorhodopirellula solitaria]|uniref:Putative ABC transporter ATP-binding protein YbhF n=1 Tax=Allorhodopirellula solitaria TaxID=2527987 RepID=A0A5C5YJR3_9BACT|nr:ABC transporter ATP-binding protein [Allorhodopirellula solitaria]TWT75134.1 putative ABC transporter ATP-binding protein YbhF [Allorhodopirellula solitaria]
MAESDVIRTRRLTRYFGHKAVVEELDFAVPRGQIVGLLGLNGAGKTTTIRMLLGLLEPTRGSCEVLGVDSRCLTPETRARIGHTVEGHFLYPWMRVRECERFGRETHPRWDGGFFERSVRRFGIDTEAKVAWLSRGQRAGVSLASTLASNPELLILDDPALGLDPVSRRALNETILEFCQSGQRSVLLSSHLLDDVERVADRVALMVDGTMVVNTTIDHFRARIAAWTIDAPDSPTAAGNLSMPVPIPRIVNCRPLGQRWQVTVVDPDEDTRAALSAIESRAMEPADVTFEDAVLAYLSRSRVYHSFYTEDAS